MNIIFINSFSSLLTEKKFWWKVLPTSIPSPYLISFNKTLGEYLGIKYKEEEINYFCGNEIQKTAMPLSMIYSGHQFGYYTPQLGDGRAILLGDVQAPSDKKLYDLVLKGAGLTPFSRMGDGRAVLRSSIREYLASESMFYLGIPTSRALSLIGSDMKIQREKKETVAVVMRIAESHIRFGSFEIYYYSKLFDMLKELTNYTIENHFSELLVEKEDSKRYLNFLKSVIELTAKMIAKWQAFGFVHGVMNTDNMSILGLTFDYGPFGFLDDYNEDQVFNCSDDLDRYSFSKQPSIGLWNLKKLGIALSPLIENEEEIKKEIDNYNVIFKKEYEYLMNQKLGLKNDDKLIYTLLSILHHCRIDFTIFFRRISHYEIGKHEKFMELFENSSKIFQEKFTVWLMKYDKILIEQGNNNDLERSVELCKVNPKYVLRNHLLETAIQKAKNGDFSEVNKLLEIMKTPFDEKEEYEDYADFPPEWAKDLHLTCSS
eukprot:gene11219-4041_t